MSISWNDVLHRSTTDTIWKNREDEVYWVNGNFISVGDASVLYSAQSLTLAAGINIGDASITYTGQSLTLGITYVTDFSEYSSSFPDWTARWHAYDALSVGTSDATCAVNCVDYDGPGDRSGISWNDPGTVTDIEALTRTTANGSAVTGSNRVYLRGSGGTTTETAYYVDIDASAEELLLYKYVSGSPTQLDSYSIPSFDVNAWYWIRFQAIGTALKARIWESGEFEPAAWHVTATDSAITSGWVGLGSYNNNAALFDWFGCNTAGNTVRFPSCDAPVITIGSASVVYASKGLSLRAIVPIASASVVYTGQSLQVLVGGGIPIGKAEVLYAGQPLTLLSYPGKPQFPIAELDPLYQGEDFHLPCGHWHAGQSDDPVWDFDEQPTLPYPYHEHPVDPKICGHWHKGGSSAVTPDEKCIQYVTETSMPFAPIAHGTYASSQGLLYHTDGFIYGVGASSTIFRFDPATMVVVNQTSFDSADISAFEQILYSGGYFYCLISRSGYTGNWIQKIEAPAIGTVGDFTLVGSPLYAGSVVRGTDGNVYGFFETTNMNNIYRAIHTPITGGAWASRAERLPDAYSYTIDADTWVYNGRAVQVANGANLINFQIVGGVFLFNNGPSSAFLTTTAAISRFTTSGAWQHTYAPNTIIGPNELSISPTGTTAALLRCTGAFTNLTLRRIDSGGTSSTDHSVAGLVDDNGATRDNSIYHSKTVFHTNGYVYSLHAMYDDTLGRIVAIHPNTGQVVGSYVFDTGLTVSQCTFEILNNYVYVWQDTITGIRRNTAIVKLTLGLEFVCIEDCSGVYEVATRFYHERGGQITSDSEQYIYNFSSTGYGGDPQVLTKYRVFVDNPHDSSQPTYAHSPVWDFDKQPDKF